MRIKDDRVHCSTLYWILEQFNKKNGINEMKSGL